MRLNGSFSLGTRTACWGALAWAAFAVIEGALSVVLPAARESALVLTPPSRLASWAVLASLYVVAGFVAGFAAGAVAAVFPVFRRADRGLPSPAPDLAQFTLVAAWVTHLVDVRHLSRSVYLSLAAALLVAVVLALRLARSRPGFPAVPWSAWLAGPWGAAVTLLAPIALRDSLHLTWLISRFGPRAAGLKMAASALVTVAVIALLVYLGRATLRLGWSASRIRVVQAAALPAVAAVVLAVAWGSDLVVLSRLREPAPQPPAARATGVLVITMDSVRADHLSAYGYRHDTTPGLRTLALARDALPSRRGGLRHVPRHARLAVHRQVPQPSWRVRGARLPGGPASRRR